MSGLQWYFVWAMLTDMYLLICRIRDVQGKCGGIKIRQKVIVGWLLLTYLHTYLWQLVLRHNLFFYRFISYHLYDIPGTYQPACIPVPRKRVKTGKINLSAEFTCTQGCQVKIDIVVFTSQHRYLALSMYNWRPVIFIGATVNNFAASGGFVSARFRDESKNLPMSTNIHPPHHKVTYNNKTNHFPLGTTYILQTLT